MSDAAMARLGGDRTTGNLAGAPLHAERLQVERLDQLVGESAAMLRVREALPRIARADGSVLIQGASGTGKDLAARIVHDLSRRSSGPFVPIDCGSLAEGVLESELFGHARGAFTGAAGERAGLFEAAHGGTLFLDEIGNTSLSFQAKLLRVLEEGEVRRLGANRTRPIDVRVVAATNRDLTSDAAAGTFRQDLLYRLDVLAVRMPALSERRDDIPVIARHLLSAIASRTGEHFELTPPALSILLAHDWPGNVRELRNVLERTTALATRSPIDVDQLPERLSTRQASPTGAQLGHMVSSCERTLILQRLQSNGWNRTRTAAELGITRRCLFNKILRHDLRPATAVR